MLVGEIRRPTIVAPSQRVDVLGVRFRIGGATAFVRAPAVALRDRMLEAEEFFPRQDSWSTRDRGEQSFHRVTREHAPPIHDLGYYDDPHRIHEFRAFSGVTPTAFRDEQNGINTAFVGNLQDTTAVAR